jgi:SAM-dependent methyltransferase
VSVREGLRALWRAARRIASADPSYEPSEQWKRLQACLAGSGRILDLGCGAHPHVRAAVAVDRFLAPEQRAEGHGATLTAGLFRDRGVAFVQADLAALPFRDREFDFAFASHVFEHLPDPEAACAEMARVARAGAIVTPSIFAEIAFGRPYHRWLVTARDGSIVFIEKTAEEDRPFGALPPRDAKGRPYADAETNPFEFALNYRGGYRGPERLPRLSRPLRRFFYSNHPVIATVFLWERDIRCAVVRADGRIVLRGGATP